jgi:ParB family transcriptional regulator, chromosome partitioning protein
VNAQKKSRLGKGLGALIEDYLEPEVPSAGGSTLPLSSIVPNPKQPRRTFNDVELAELTASIKANGLLQPLLVRPTASGSDRFELVAGERRLRAIRTLGWEEAPVVIREVDDDTLLVLALVENLQREALNPIEEAEGYQALSEEHGLTQGEIATSVGKNRSTVANMLRLLKLPPSVRKLVEAGVLTMGHARALLGLDDPIRMADLARQAVKEGWSVREMERRTKQTPGPSPRKTPTKDPVSHALEEELRSILGAKVLIRANRKGTKGVIEVPFHTAEEFERVFALVAGKEVSEVVG